MKRINEQEVIYNEVVKEFDRMEKDYSNQLSRKDKTIKKKDNEIKKLREIIGSCGISAEMLALKLKA